MILSKKSVKSTFFMDINHNLYLPYISGSFLLEVYSDPLPQALVLTSIVISLSTTSILLSLIYYINKKYKTTNVSRLNKLKG